MPFLSLDQVQRMFREKIMIDFPIIAGEIALNFFFDSFDNEAWEGVKWQDRKKKDKNPAKRNLLVKRGRLRRSLRVIETKIGYVKIATDVPYAQIHNEGGTITGTANVKRHIRRIHSRSRYAKTQKGNQKTAQGIAFIKAHTRTVNIPIPKRQFMGESNQLNTKIRKELEKEFGNLVNAIRLLPPKI